MNPATVKLIAAYLGKVRLSECAEYIEHDRDLLAPVSEQDWRRIRAAAKLARIELTYEAVVEVLKKECPGLFGVIVSTDGGVAWLERQVKTARDRILTVK